MIYGKKKGSYIIRSSGTNLLSISCHSHTRVLLPALESIIIIIIIIIKRGWQCKAGRERLTPYQSEDPNNTTPTHRKKEEKGKTVGDKKGASSKANKKALALLLNLKPASPTPSNTGSLRAFHRDTEKGTKVRRYCEVLQRGGA